MIYKVGPAEALKTILEVPSTLAAGDIVEIQPGVYKEVRVWPLVGTPANPVIIRAAVRHSVTFDAAGVQLAFTPRAIFQVNDGAYTIQGIKFRNASNGGLNASAIRCVAGQLIVEDCWIRNCSMGIQTTAPSLVIIRGCDIGWCGFGNNSHNIYLSGGTESILEDNIIERSVGGINVKIRTRLSRVIRNKIWDSKDGELQFCDGPETLTTGADAVAEDNDIRTLPTRNGGNIARVIAFGHEGKPDTDRIGTLRLINNKINLRSPSNICVSLDSLNAGLEAEDNVIEGVSNNLLRVRYASSSPVTATKNYMGTTPFTGFTLVYTPVVPPPPDFQAPPQPQNLQATQTAKTITLTWDPSTATDISHYEVDAPYGPYSMGDENFFTHVTNIYAGRSYNFKVIAVDKAGNRSLPALLTVVKV